MWNFYSVCNYNVMYIIAENVEELKPLRPFFRLKKFVFVIKRKQEYDVIYIDAA